MALRLFRQIIDSTRQAVAVHDREGRLVYINPAHERLFGRFLHEAARMNDLDTYTLDSNKILSRKVLPQLARGEGWEGQLDAFDADGRKFPLWVRADTICDADGNLLYSFRIMHDMTDLKESEARRLDIERRLHLNQKRESLGNLAGGVAHHFNNLLMAVQGNLELVQDDLQPHDKAFRLLSQAQEAARRAQNLSGLMLTYLGHGVGIKSLCNISEELSRIVPLVAGSLPRNVCMKTLFTPTLPWIRADAENLRLVALNLMTNALEALEDRGGEVVFATGIDFYGEADLRQTVGTEVLKEGDYVFLEVKDNGCGMAPEIVAQMFDPFFSTKFTGRGLGLASVLGIVQGHKGAMAVASAPGMGTTVRALFPPASELKR
jgi:PAS domain S-box-containing protein